MALTELISETGLDDGFFFVEADDAFLSQACDLRLTL